MFPTTAQHANAQVLRFIQGYLRGTRYKEGRQAQDGTMFPFSFALLTPSNQLLAAEAVVWITQRNSATQIRPQLSIGMKRAQELRDELARQGFAEQDAPPSPQNVSSELKPLLIASGILTEEETAEVVDFIEEETEQVASTEEHLTV